MRELLAALSGKALLLLRVCTSGSFGCVEWACARVACRSVRFTRCGSAALDLQWLAWVAGCFEERRGLRCCWDRRTCTTAAVALQSTGAAVAIMGRKAAEMSGKCRDRGHCLRYRASRPSSAVSVGFRGWEACTQTGQEIDTVDVQTRSEAALPRRLRPAAPKQTS